MNVEHLRVIALMLPPIGMATRIWWTARRELEELAGLAGLGELAELGTGSAVPGSRFIARAEPP